MNTTSLRRKRYRNVALWAAALVCLNGVACFRSVDPSKLKCNSESSCPNLYFCSMDQGTYGHCVVGPVSLDGGNTDLSPSLGLDGTARSDGIESSDGAGVSPLDGSRGSNDATTTVDGPDGVSGLIDAALGGAGGAGGTMPLDAPSATGGSGGIISPDAPSATGGVMSTGGSTSTPDAPILDAPIPNDGRDALATLSNGSSCAADSQCGSGHCADGFCCDSACTGQCQSCSASPGTCRNVTTARSSCGGTAPCAGYCSGTAPACVFPDATTPCSAATCADTKTSRLAGACNSAGACSPGALQSCQYVCVSTTGACGGSCNPGDLRCNSTTRQQCSTSGQYQDDACPTNQVCSGTGSCGCPSNTCGTTCQMCSGGRTCSAGNCTCPSLTTDCGTSGCINVLGNDNNNCGGCGHSCNPGETCSAGTCLVPNGGICSVGTQCLHGNCTNTRCCDPGQTYCGGCTSTATDSNNCGICGRTCGSTTVCANSLCKFVDGQLCGIGQDADCASGKCQIYCDTSVPWADPHCGTAAFIPPSLVVGSCP